MVSTRRKPSVREYQVGDTVEVCIVCIYDLCTDPCAELRYGTGWPCVCLFVCVRE